MTSKFSDKLKKDIESSSNTIIPKFLVNSSANSDNPLTTNFSESNQRPENYSWDNFIEKRK